MGKLSSGILFLMMVTLLLVPDANGTSEQVPPLYTTYGLSPGGFGIYDKQYLGAAGHFSMPAIAPFYIMQSVSNFGKGLILDDKLKRIEWWVEFLTDKELDLRDNYNSLMGQFQQTSGLAKRFSSNPWGFCVANGDNQSSGADNLVLITLPKEDNVIWIDLAHSDNLLANKDLVSSIINVDDDVMEVVEKIADILDIKIPNIKIPGGGIFDLPNSPGDGVDHFRNPRGICTNRTGEFWIADCGNNQIVRARFNTDHNFVELLGMLKGLNSPSDVCVFPGNTPESPEVLGIANTDGHSVVFTKANFFGEANLQDQEKFELKNVYLSGNQFNISAPLSISSSNIYSDECYFTCNNNKIVKLRRRGQYEFTSEAVTEWPLQGVLTGIKTDQDGDPFVVDNTNNYIGKYTRNFQLLFTTGGTNPDANTLVDEFKYGYIYFENPKYISFGTDERSVFITERMRGYSGIKRFLNWPRFHDGSNTFGLKCDENGLVDPSKMEIRFSLTKRAIIEVSILRVDGDDQQVFFDSRNFVEFNNTFSSGEHILNFDFNDDEGANNSSIAYICDFKAYDPTFTEEESDRKTYIISLGSPNFFGDATLSNSFFNPANNVFPQLSFEVSRSSRVTYRLVRSGDSFENGISIAQALFNRNQTEPHIINLQEIPNGSNLVPMTSDNVRTVLGSTSYELWASLEALPCGASN